MQSVCPGYYRHYKGGLYQVYEVARHSETEQPYVVYRPLYGERQLWIRPLELFTDTVTVAHEPVARFTWIGEQRPDEE